MDLQALLHQTTAIALETGKGYFADGIALGLVLIAIALGAAISISKES